MKRAVIAVLLIVLAIAVPSLRSQDKAKSTEGAKPAEPPAPQIIPLRVQVVFIEYDGDKKVSNLPYTLLVNANERGPQAAVRMGLRVPIETSSSGAADRHFQYQDVGTNLDGSATMIEDGKFNLRLNVEKSSLYTPGSGEKRATVGGNEILAGQPIFQSFRSQVNLLVRDGQTIQSTVATDPVTGRVLKVEVTLNVIK